MPQGDKPLAPKGTNLYIHVPFCASRCSYCDFYTQTNLGLRARYLKALHTELSTRRAELPPHSTLQNIYLGGGTPSLLSPSELEQLFAHIYQTYPVDSDAEITLEANPDDLRPGYVEALQSLPINRVSMGLQSFHNDELRALGRRHSAQQAEEAVTRLRRSGIQNLSLDLIYGLPGQSLERWQQNLERILALDVPHISAYHLIYEEGTPLALRRDRGLVQELSEEESLSCFRLLIERLREAGYEHYEISNFARPGCYARLNTGYWQGMPYIGCGPSAHSYDGQSRSANVPDLSAYLEGWQKGIRRCERERLSPRDQHNEYVMTRLRTQWGINLEDLEALFGIPARERLMHRVDPYLRKGLLSLDGSTLSLSSEGIFVSDGIIAALFS